MIRFALLIGAALTYAWAEGETQNIDTVWTSLAFVFLLLLSAFFSGSEIALVSLSHARARALKEKGIPGSHAIIALKSAPNRMLITILLGNNLVNIAASVLATVWATAIFGSSALGWVTGFLTLIVLVAGEIFPKAFAQRHNEFFARHSAPLLLFLQTVFLPLVIALEWLLSMLIVRAGSQKTAHITALGELKALIRIVAEKREIDENLQDILESAFEFDRTRVGPIMTPLSRLVTTKTTDTIERLRELFIEKGRSRIPVFEGKNVAGLVNMQLLLEAQLRGLTHVGQMPLIPVVRVQASAYIDDLLLTLQEANQQLALVYDGDRLVGLVTVENILEEIVGEMHDEKEPVFRRALFGKRR